MCTLPMLTELFISFNSIQLKKKTKKEEEEEEEEEEEVMASDHEEYHYLASISRLSRLSIESSDGGDADAEMSDEEGCHDKFAITKNFSIFSDPFIEDARAGFTTSLPGTPERARLLTEPSEKDSVSEAGEQPCGRRKKGCGKRVRERRLEHAWEMRKTSMNKENDSCKALVRSLSSPIIMDVDEVKACRELGFELPCDWTVKISGGADSSSGGNSPIASHGDDPRDVKARLKVWAQAVALASASTSSSG